MSAKTMLRMRLLAVCCTGTLLMNGCLSVAGNLIDQFLAPTAFSNALRIPFSPVGDLIQLLRVFG